MNLVANGTSVTNVALVYAMDNLAGISPVCTSLSSTIQNATLQHFMNMAACSESCTIAVQYVAKYIPGVGNMLENVIIGGSYYPNSASPKGHWAIHKKDVAGPLPNQTINGNYVVDSDVWYIFTWVTDNLEEKRT